MAWPRNAILLLYGHVSLHLIGTIYGLTDQIACVGEAIVYNCTVRSEAHYWNVSSLPGDQVVINREKPMSLKGDYQFRLVEDNGDALVTSLTILVVSDVHDGITVACNEDGVSEETTVNVLQDPLSPPEMTVQSMTFQSFTFVITPPEESGKCVIVYTITSTSSDGTVRDFTVEVTERGRRVSVPISGFNLCSNTYSFTVSAATATLVGESSGVIYPNENPGQAMGITDISLLLIDSGFRVKLTGMTTTFFIGATVLVQRSPVASDSCEDVVFSLLLNSSSVTVVDSLNCKYAGRKVTYCLQFDIEECQPIPTMQTIEFPSLLSSPHSIGGLVSGSVGISVDVNVQAHCNDIDKLTITATIAKGSRVISSQKASFANTTLIVMFESILPGDYTCSVRVEDGTGPVETVQIPCTSFGTRYMYIAVVVVGVICALVGCVGIVVCIAVLKRICTPKKIKASKREYPMENPSDVPFQFSNLSCIPSPVQILDDLWEDIFITPDNSFSKLRLR